MRARTGPSARRPRAAAVLFAGLAGLLGCQSSRPTPEDSPLPVSPSTPAEAAPADVLRRVADAEQRRATDAISDAELGNRDVRVRRLAARALARIADEAAVDRLMGALSDEDDEVVGWAAYGLGYACDGRENRTVRALVARAASLTSVTERSPARDENESRFSVEPWFSIMDALSRCGTVEAEATLRAFLSAIPERAAPAALALARLGKRRGRLQDATLVTLLDAASRTEKPLVDALAPFAYLRRLGSGVATRLLDVAGHALTFGGRGRTLAIRSLPGVGETSAPLLFDVLSGKEHTSTDRSLAAQSLAELGTAGQRALRKALASLVENPRTLEAEVLTRSGWAPLLSTLRALEPPVPDSYERLRALATWPVPDEPKALRRRVVAVRCAAGSLLAGGASLAPSLVGCDPDEGRAGALAALEVLDREPIEGPRRLRWLQFTKAADPAVRRAALGLLIGHPEIQGASAVIAAALAAKEPGVVGTAARALAQRSAAASSESAPEPTQKASATRPIPDDFALGRALSAALETSRPADEIETTGLLLQAAGALKLLSAKPRVEAACASDNPTLRQHARRALLLFGQALADCATAARPGASVPIAFDASAQRSVSLTFVTDSERLGVTLEPALAPAAVARIVDLAQSGFYDAMVIHRVVPGAIVQLGDNTGDGYGGSGRAPLRCETSPIPFESLRVGLAISGRDTGSSQIFVTLSPEPHLDGDYPLIGFADPEWKTVLEGDVIRRIEIKR